MRIDNLPVAAVVNDNDKLLLTKLQGTNNISSNVNAKDLATYIKNKNVPDLVELGRGTCGTNFQLNSKFNDYKLFYVYVECTKDGTTMPGVGGLIPLNWNDGISYFFSTDYCFSTKFVINTQGVVTFSKSWCEGKYGGTTINSNELSVYVYGVN